MHFTPTDKTNLIAAIYQLTEGSLRSYDDIDKEDMETLLTHIEADQSSEFTPNADKYAEIQWQLLDATQLLLQTHAGNIQVVVISAQDFVDPRDDPLQLLEGDVLDGELVTPSPSPSQTGLHFHFGGASSPPSDKADARTPEDEERQRVQRQSQSLC